MLRVLLLLALLLPSTALAVPQLITYSGRILDEAGDPIEGEVVISVGLFDQVTDPNDEVGLGSPSWSDDFIVIAVNGYFSVILGSQTVLSSDNLTADTLYVTLAVDSGPWMVPASEMTSSAFSLRAEAADTALVADVALAVEEGPVAATEVTVNGNTVIDQSGNWTGPIETTEAVKVGSLWVDGVLILDNNNWVGPAPDLPAGTLVDGSAPLLETELADATTALGTYVDDTIIGPIDNANPKNHDRYTKDDLLMEITGAVSVSAIPTGADENLYHTPVTATDLEGDLDGLYLAIGGATASGELVLGGGGDVRGQNSDDPSLVSPAQLDFSLAPSPTETDPTDTWRIQAESGSFVLSDRLDQTDEYLVMTEDALGAGTIQLKPNGVEALTLTENTLTFAPDGAAGVSMGAESFVVSPQNSGVTNVVEVGPDSVALLAAPIGNVLEVSETSLAGQYQVQANLGGSTLLDIQETDVTLGATGVGVTVADGLTVNGTVNFNGGQTLGGSQVVEGTLNVDPNADNTIELDVQNDSVTLNAPLTVTTGGADITGDTTINGNLGVVGNLSLNDGANDVLQSTSTTLSTTLAVDIDPNGDGLDEVQTAGGSVALMAAPIGNVFEVSETATPGQYQVQASLGGNTLVDVQQGGITLGATGVDVTVADGLTVNGTVNFNGGQTLGGGQAVDGTLEVDPDLDDSFELDVQADSVTLNAPLTVATGGAGITGNSTVTGDLGVVGNFTVNDGVGDVLNATGTTLSTTLATTVDPDGDGVYELDVAADAVDMVASLTIDADGDNIDEFAVTASGVDFGAGITTSAGNLVVPADTDVTPMLTLVDGTSITAANQVIVSSGGIDINNGGLTVDNDTGIDVNAGGITVDSGGITINTNTGLDVNAGGITVDGGSLVVSSGTTDFNTSTVVDATLTVDPSNNGSNALSVTSSTVDANVQITADGGIQMASTNTVTGTLVRSSCPSGMDAIVDSWTNKSCIDTSYTATSSTWFSAQTSCGNAGKKLCEVWQLAACDQSGDCAANTGGQLDRASSSADVGDDNNLSGNAEFWTNESAAGTGSTDAIKFWAWDVRSATDDADDDLESFDGAATSFYFYCCLDPL